MELHTLTTVIVAAKAATYVGGGTKAAPSRLGSHDLGWASSNWRYLDSYFGGTDFLGQEVVWKDDQPVWAMNYYGRILDPGLIDGAAAGAVIKDALSALYRSGRFLGGFDYSAGQYRYADESNDDVSCFLGIERIYAGVKEVYRLDYHGGIVKP